MLGVAALVALNQALMAWRFSLAFEECAGHGVPFGTWFRLTAVGQLLNVFVPQLGNAYRALVLKREHQVSYLTYASGLFAYVWLDLLMGFFIAFVVIGSFDPGLRLAALPALSWLGASMVGLFVMPFVAAHGIRAFRLGEGVAARVQAKMSSLLETTNRALRNPRFLLRVLGVNVFSTAGQVATLWLCFHAVGGNLSSSALIVFQVFTKLSNQVTVTPGNLGLNEIAFGILARASAQSLEQGVAVSLSIRAVGTVMQIVLGLLAGGGSRLFSGREQLERERDQELDAVPGAATGRWFDRVERRRSS
jgi:uncharacterized membrane protein YbhN (UPF0104 family)